MTENLKGKVAWITGGGSGIGLAGAIELARAGAHVVISGRSKATIAVDASNQKEVAAAAAAIVRQHGHIDILVNSAGINTPKRNFRDVSIESWDQIVAINLSGVFYCCHAVLPAMRKRKDGLVINVSS